MYDLDKWHEFETLNPTTFCKHVPVLVTETITGYFLGIITIKVYVAQGNIFIILFHAIND